MSNGPQLSERDFINAKDLTCAECGCRTFNNVFIIKHISALLSPSGREINAPIPTFSCTKCGHINKEFLPPEGPKDD